jgi:hypothetical protein
MDMRWLRIDLSRQQIAEGALSRIQQECFRWYLAARTPPGAQLLSKASDSRRLKDVAMELYFSPAMARICRDAIAGYHPAVASGSLPGAATLLVGSPPECDR